MTVLLMHWILWLIQILICLIVVFVLVQAYGVWLTLSLDDLLRGLLQVILIYSVFREHIDRFKKVELVSDIFWFLFGDVDENVFEETQLGVIRVVTPCNDLNSILFLAAEILSQIIDDHGLAQISSRQWEVFDVWLDEACGWILDLDCVLAVESMSDEPLSIQVI